jgi:nitroimidazol reductase NimA-like FMN-containing flavoprotein (pyridoxamine 5'-phosphate oxidase superfamily)
MDGSPDQRAKHLIEDVDHMMLATADPSGKPWVSPVFFVPDPDGYDLYWTSWKDAKHSQNIRGNAQVGIAIYETEPRTDAVYIAARAVELDDPDEVRHGIEVMARREQPDRWVIKDSSNVTGEGPWRIYRASPETIDVRADAEAGGLPIVTRQRADFRQTS